ncbi:MAG: DUF6504 family protein [Anaerolineae bacterium]|jgi:hypothetical protein|nr:DUF6504 family protein [Anaerolineae bacterium]MDH7475081.1 DUF6504 family protein [Anaerolineae bacterium]
MQEPVEVECYSGHTYAQRPRAFTWRGQRYQVEAVERTWRTPQGLHFRVRTPEDSVFELVYNEHEDVWFLETGHRNIGCAQPPQ